MTDCLYAKPIKMPKLLFFQGKQDDLPGFLKLHQQLQVKCLSENFEVVLINKNCDYKQLCDIHQPDIALFEIGYKSTIPNKLSIKNTSAYPEVPKIGLHNGDGWCECRVGLFHDMQQWGIETVFSISVTTAENTPIIADDLFVWPNFIDSEIYHDYYQEKVVDVLFNGSMISLYPWRQKIHEIVSTKYPAVVLPHLGYGAGSSNMVFGTAYAEKINSSWFVPACGTISKEVVRKHFEVPGCRSCLITEQTPALEAAGFVDMENCVFADENDVLEKIAFLMNNRTILQGIIDAGYELVQRKHTLKHRKQIFQWYELNKHLKSNQRIVQSGPFEPLQVVEKSSGIVNSHIKSKGLISLLLKDAHESMAKGDYESAEMLNLECLKYIPWMSEPKLKLAICNLYKGNANQALIWVTDPIHNCLGNYNCQEPDPIEWAYLIISLLCQGNLTKAAIRSKQFPELHHPELEHIRWVINYIFDFKDEGSHPEGNTFKQRQSIHHIQVIQFEAWIDNLIMMLRSCQQENYANILSKANTLSKPQPDMPLLNGKRMILKNLIQLQMAVARQLNILFKALDVPNRNTGMPSVYISDYIIRLAKWTRISLLFLSLINLKINAGISYHLYT